MSKKRIVKRKRIQAVRKIDQRMSQKLAGLFCAVVVALVLLITYITYINATEGEQYKRQVMSQTQQRYGSQTLPNKRGDIYDRNGTILATSEKVYNIIFDCSVVNTELKIDGKMQKIYVEPTIKALQEVFGIEEEVLRDKLEKEKTKNSQYEVIKKGISITEKHDFEKYRDVPELRAKKKENEKSLTEEEREILNERAHIRGVWFQEEYVRKYPLNSLACDLVGFTNKGNSADWGIEGYYSDILNGVDGRKFGYYNENSDIEQTVISPKDGNHVVSTVDIMVQQIIRSAIEKFNMEMSGGDDLRQSGAENIGVIVMDPNTGEILGMDSNNWYDLNNPRELSDFYSQEELSKMDEKKRLDALNALWRNYCISDAFEIGSTVKPMTVAGALESGAISPDDTFVCNGYEMIDGQRVRCSVYPNAHGTQTLADAMKNSCNDAMMEIAKRQGKEDFSKYQNTFNFSIKTGIDLPGEAAGNTFSPDSMRNVELATSSFGQGFTASMIQEVAAFSSVINGGYYYKPHVVKKILDSQGAVLSETAPVLMKQTISPEVSELVRSYCQAVTGPTGTGRHAKVPGYSMGGKTGTAQKTSVDETDGKRKYMGKYIVSYISYAPAINPQVVVYVVVDEPHADYQANSGYAQSITYNIMKELLPYMNIFRDEDANGNQLAVPEELDIAELSNRTADGQKKPGNKKKNQKQEEEQGEAQTSAGELSDPATDQPPKEEEPNTQGGENLLENGMTNQESEMIN